MTGMTGFLVAVGGVSLICYWLMTRVQNRAARRSVYGGSGTDTSFGPGSSSSGAGWSLSSWFGSDGSSSHDTGSSSDSGGGGGGDSGGGGDGGGGGGD